MPGTATRWVLAVATVTTVVAIGTPLVGLDTFFPADNVFVHPPWAREAPADLRPTNPLLADPVDGGMPRQVETARRLRAGDLPLWNPYPQGGVPLVTQLPGGAVSPMRLPGLVLPAWYAPAIVKLLEIAVAIGFTFLFLRRLSVGRPAALLGGLAFAFSGFQVAWTHWPHSAVAALIPAVFWGIERARDGGAAAFLPLAVATAVMLLSGFPPVAAFGLLAAGAYALARVATGPGSPVVRLRTLVGLAAAVGLGLALTAFQTLPFLERLGRVALDYRQQSPAAHLPVSALATAAVPNALGSPVWRVGLAGVPGAPEVYVNYQSFVGVTALVLVVIAAVRGRRGADTWALHPFFGWAAAALAGLVYLGGPPLQLLQSLPVVRPLFAINSIDRAHAVLGFVLAVLAAGGFQALLTDAGAEDRDGTSRGRVAGVLAATAALVVWVLAEAIADASAGGLLGWLGLQAALPALVAVLAVLAVTRWRRRRFRVPRLAAVQPSIGYRLRGLPVVAVVVPALLAVEILAFTLPYWPRVDPDRFYPTTPAHRFLQRELGPDRLAAAHRVLYPGTTTVYRLRSVTAHMFQPEPWADLLRTADPAAFRRGTDRPPVRWATFPHLRAVPEVVGSPVLDRLAARFFAADPYHPLLGETVEVSEPADEEAFLVLRPDEPVTAPLPRTDLRGVTVRLADPFARSSGRALLRVEVLRPDGTVLTAGSRRLFPSSPPIALAAGSAGVLGIGPPGDGADGNGRESYATPFGGDGPGPVTVPVPEPVGDAADGPGRVRIRLDAPDGHVTLRAADDGQPALGVVLTADDGLRLAFATGAVIYERLGALDRIRWASRAEMVDEPVARVARLSAGPPPDTVVLSAPARPTGGRPAAVQVLRDGPDRITATVDAEGPGYLVVADDLQDTWRATVDGGPVPVVAADHALGAVHVPAGFHRVELVHDPPGWSLGLRVSAAAAGLAVLVGLVSAWRRRRGAGPGRAAPDRRRQDGFVGIT